MSTQINVVKICTCRYLKIFITALWQAHNYTKQNWQTSFFCFHDLCFCNWHTTLQTRQWRVSDTRLVRNWTTSSHSHTIQLKVKTNIFDTTKRSLFTLFVEAHLVGLHHRPDDIHSSYHHSNFYYHIITTVEMYCISTFKIQPELDLAGFTSSNAAEAGLGRKLLHLYKHWFSAIQVK